MSTGGEFQTQNKVRPGAYINFIGTPKSLSTVGERGIIAIPMSLSWGDTLTELSAQDLVTGASLEKVGVLFTDDDAISLRLALQSCSKAIIYRLNNEAVKAAKTIGGIAFEAVYGGTFGNQIEVSVTVTTVDSSTTYEVKTYANGLLKDSQRVGNTNNLVSNSFVTMTPGESVTTAARTALEGGTNGTEPSDISEALAAFANYKFNILAITQASLTIKAQAVQFVESLRNNQGIKVQVVLNDYASDSEAVIVSVQGYNLSDGTPVSTAQAVLAIASMEAGATITESLSGAVIPDAVSVVGAPVTHDAIVESLEAGKLVLSRRADGAIVIEKDQNSLHTFTPTKGYVFSKNRPLRVLDQIGNDIKALFNDSYLGKVSNDEAGRNIFKGDLASYFNELQSMGAVQNFDLDDLMVLAGNDTDSVVVQLYVQPIDSMEKLYMTVNVES